MPQQHHHFHSVLDASVEPQTLDNQLSQNRVDIIPVMVLPKETSISLLKGKSNHRHTEVTGGVLMAVIQWKKSPFGTVSLKGMCMLKHYDWYDLGSIFCHLFYILWEFQGTRDVSMNIIINKNML